MSTVQRAPHTQPECSLEARLIAERLSTMAVEETVLYHELFQLTGLDIQKRRRDLLYTALKLVLEEHGMVFGCETGKGLKRLSDTGIVGTGEQYFRRSRRAVRRIQRKLVQANPEALEPPERQRLWAYQGLLAAQAVLLHPKAVTQARQMAQPQQLPWESQTVTALFVAARDRRG